MEANRLEHLVEDRVKERSDSLGSIAGDREIEFSECQVLCS